MKELRIPRAGRIMPGAVGISRNDLIPDIIDSCHILPCHGTEIVSRTAPQSGVLSVILDHVPDILHPVAPAPLSDLPAEVLCIKPAHTVHIVESQRGALPAFVFVPEIRDLLFPSRPADGLHFFLQFTAPGKRHHLLPDLIVHLQIICIVKSRLI